MASEKDTMLSSANYYIGKVTTAKNACEAAAKNMISPQYDVSHNWSGASGNAMSQALDDLRYEINKAYARLVTLESQMRSHANSIYYNWPIETPKQTTSGSTKQTSSTSTKKTTSTSTKTTTSKTTSKKTTTSKTKSTKKTGKTGGR